MGVAPDLSAEVDGREDGRGVYPNVMKNVGPEWSDEMKGVGVKIGDTGDVTEEVSVNELLLGDPKFIAAVVNDGVLVWVTVSDKGAGGGSEKVREDFC